jgi:uncharacterized protein (DUF3820 family)
VENIRPDPGILLALVQTRMPYGKYKGTLLCDIPVSYLEWMQQNGMPAGKLGMMLNSVLEIKMNGLTSILHSVKNSINSR